MTETSGEYSHYVGQLLDQIEKAGFVVGPEFAEAVAHRESLNGQYIEFLRTEDASAGVIQLASGQEDAQQPHTEDEVYLVLQGEGEIQVGLESREIRPGSVVVVGSGVKHYFHSLTEDLTALVVFMPPEGTNN
jgi:mannose-6-phosphate isomerase-like protein (cupin superfamily)